MGRQFIDEESEDEEWYETADRLDPDGETGLGYQLLLRAQGVERKCCYCEATFIGMPDHGVCNRCADILERGGDPCG